MRDKSFINDRGSKKWTALMLPEHIAELKELFAEQDHKEKPILDEQQLIENEMLLNQAIEGDLTITVKYFKDYNYHFAEGKVLFIQSQDRYLQLDKVKINLDSIVEVNVG